MAGRERHKPFFLGSSSSMAAGLFELRLLDIGVVDIMCMARSGRYVVDVETRNVGTARKSGRAA